MDEIQRIVDLQLLDQFFIKCTDRDGNILYRSFAAFGRDNHFLKLGIGEIGQRNGCGQNKRKITVMTARVH